MDDRPVTIRPLGPDTLPLFLRFFDGDAFADNPKWSSCYCQCFYEDHAVVTWSERTATQNRALACRRTAAAEMQGYLALDGDDAGRLVRRGAAPPAARARRRADARCRRGGHDHLLPGHAEPARPGDRTGAARCGLRRPARTGPRDRRSEPAAERQDPAENHFGPLALYLSAGFTVHREDTDGSVYVRRPLSPQSP
jgi:hypothetical protein